MPIFLVIQISKFFPASSVERQYPPYALTAVILASRHILQRKNYFFMHDRIAIPEALSSRQGIHIHLPYTGT